MSAPQVEIQTVDAALTCEMLSASPKRQAISDREIDQADAHDMGHDRAPLVECVGTTRAFRTPEPRGLRDDKPSEQDACTSSQRPILPDLCGLYSFRDAELSVNGHREIASAISAREGQ